MTEEIKSQDAGINADTVDEETIETEVEETQTEESKDTKATTKGKSNVPKILAEKNKWKAEAEKWKAEAESKEFSEEKAQALIQQAIAESKMNDLKANERNNFLETYWEENLEAVESTLEQHPSLTYEQAATIAGIGFTQPSNPNKYSVAWNTPSSIRKPKTVADISDDDLKAKLVAEFQDAGFNNAR